MFHLQIEGDFASAHQLREYKGKCENLHGHNWRVLVRVCGRKLGPSGMLIDFGVLKAKLRARLEGLDHQFLNELPPFDVVNPTSENLAKHIFETLDADLPDGVGMHEVRVWESEKSAASYMRD
ncbi:MAG: 6-carboxytetrahydropterin synthase QueD [Planctomycetota bacterium]|jgi:6-pyruvoyltetrahydropterin/6-carboxytetrahydropterin synthase|nr:6-carboxytetrahydropterin synthase QueD [Planctomycetota bacterium]